MISRPLGFTEVRIIFLGMLTLALGSQFHSRIDQTTSIVIYSVSAIVLVAGVAIAAGINLRQEPIVIFELSVLIWWGNRTNTSDMGDVVGMFCILGFALAIIWLLCDFFQHEDYPANLVGKPRCEKE